MTKEQVYLLFPFIKQRREFSRQLLEAFTRIASTMEIYRLTEYGVDGGEIEEYPCCTAYYLEYSHADIAQRYNACGDSYFRIDKRESPIGSHECRSAIQNSKGDMDREPPPPVENEDEDY